MVQSYRVGAIDSAANSIEETVMMKKSLTIVLAIAFASAAFSTASADNEKGTAVVKGKVVFDGAPTAPSPLKMAGDQVCAKANPNAVPDQDTIVYTKSGNAIPYVFVYVKKGIKGKYTPPAEPKVIDQQGCKYHPHVMGMIAGQTIQIKNSDPTNHNIHSLAQKNNQFNFAQPNLNMVKELKGGDTFNREEVLVKIKCDVHAWMSTYVGVLTHPFFAVSKSHDDDKAADADKGTFEIKELLAGEYEIEAIHPKFGKATQTVTIKDGETKTIEFKLGGKAAQAPTPTRTVILGDKVEVNQKTP